MGKTAKILFEELDYKTKDKQNETLFKWIKEKDGFVYIISFWNDEVKGYDATQHDRREDGNWTEYGMLVDMKTNKAIQQQIKELGW
jgi:hypothetical protein